MYSTKFLCFKQNNIMHTLSDIPGMDTRVHWLDPLLLSTRKL